MRFGLLFALAFVSPAVAAETFDAPLKTEIVSTGPKTSRHCLTFPNFLLKWDAEGQGGSPLIVIVAGKGPWSCAEVIAGQKHLLHWKVVRVKGPYIVLSQRPNAHYAAEFKVFDTVAWRYAAEAALLNDFTAVRLEGAALVLRFRRSVYLDCSLYYGAGTACWSQIKALSGLTDEQMPDCRAVYEKAKRERNVADITGYPATVTFNAELRIAGGKSMPGVALGPVSCEP